MIERLTGYHAIEERLRSGAHGAILHVGRGNPRIERLEELAHQRGAAIAHETEEELTRLCGHPEHRGAVLTCEVSDSSPRHTLERFLESTPGEQALVVLLCGITDPHNLGAIVRSADQLGVELVVIPERRSARDSETLARTSSGAIAHVPVAVVPNIDRAVARLKECGFWVYGADAKGQRADSARLDGRVALVLGSEGSGIPRLVAEHCDGLVSIPSAGRVDSFNVSVAAGILMYEVRRQQGFPFEPRGAGRPAGGRRGEVRTKRDE